MTVGDDLKAPHVWIPRLENVLHRRAARLADVELLVHWSRMHDTTLKPPTP
jgi:hypothetical protein